ncbi:MAG: hypothetical protein BroJett003_13080 [Planctomycetota bacterium]|nr:MAG: hypothetical protein BroJett003_13080 [Planctomycetota bacterium]
MYKWFLVGRYLRTKLVAFFAICAVMLCVAMMLVVLSVMGGFLDMVKERSRGLLSDLVVDNGSLQGFPFYEEFTAHLKEKHANLVAAATPVIYNYGVLRSPRNYYTKPVRVVGVRLDEYRTVNDFGASLYYDRYYPGTTHLGPQQQPLAGVGEDNKLRLPDELEAANRAWRDRETDRGDVATYLARPFSVIGGDERVFATAADTEEFQDLQAEPDLRPRWHGDPRHGVIIGTDVINDRTASGGTRRFFKKGEAMVLTVIPMTASGVTSAEGMPALPVRYADDSRTGVYEIDSLCVYVDFNYIQEQLAMNAQTLDDGTVQPARTSQILISLKPGVDYRAARETIEETWITFRDSLSLAFDAPEQELLSFVKVQTWEQMQAGFIAAVEKEKNLVTVLFGVVMLVAVVLIGLVFWMIVEKKTKDIGVLKSMGASSPGIAGVFVAYAVAIGIVGAVLGSIGGSVFVHYINEVQDLLASINPSFRVWSPDVYSFDRIPNVVKTHDIIWISLAAVAASILGALIPAIHASAVWPVRALRYE